MDDADADKFDVAVNALPTAEGIAWRAGSNFSGYNEETLQYTRKLLVGFMLLLFIQEQQHYWKSTPLL